MIPKLISKFFKNPILTCYYLLIPLIIVTSFSACRTVDLSKYPKAERTLFIFNFTNASFEPDVNRVLYRAATSELGRRGNFILQRDKNTVKYRIYGDIVAFRQRGLMFDNFRNPSRIEYTLVCRVKFFTKVNGSNHLLKSKEVGAQVSFSPTEGIQESKQQALDRLSQIVAARIANMLENEFLNLHK